MKPLLFINSYQVLTLRVRGVRQKPQKLLPLSRRVTGSHFFFRVDWTLDEWEGSKTTNMNERQARPPDVGRSYESELISVSWKRLFPLMDTSRWGLMVTKMTSVELSSSSVSKLCSDNGYSANSPCLEAPGYACR